MSEHISHLRAQLLWSEQEKELMRIKLQEEKVEREKAQKQVGAVCWLNSQDVGAGLNYVAGGLTKVTR